MKKMMLVVTALAVLMFMVGDQVAAATVKEWTFMVYLDGDNNLEPDSINDFKEMGTVGSDANLNIVVQYDRVPGYSTACGNWTDCRRFYVEKGATAAASPLENLGEVNMGSKTTLTNFIKWAAAKYPAKHYVLVLWNHGGGWRARGARAQVHKAICWDDTNNGECLYMKDVQSAIRSAGVKFDVIGCDACLMGMVEVATDLKDLTNVLVASEEVEPGAGWPYDKILAKLVATPTMTARELGSIIVDEYNTYYKGKDAAVTQGAIDLTKIGAVNTAVKQFVSAANQWAKLKTARTATRTYSEADGYPHADLYHFMSLLASKGVTDPAVLAAATAVQNAIKAAVINVKAGSSRSNTNGLAIFFPKTKTAYNDAEGSDYPTHDFNLATGWNAFLLKYFNPPADIQTGGSTCDGSGKAKFSRSTPVTPGYKLSSVTLTFTAAVDLSGGQVVMTVPDGWTAPSSEGAGLIETLEGTGVTIKSAVVDGRQVIVDLTTLPAGKTFKIYYKKSVAPTATGAYTFAISSKGKGGTLKPIEASPALVVAQSSSSRHEVTSGD